jgi:hypothetical protein
MKQILTRSTAAAVLILGSACSGGSSAEDSGEPEATKSNPDTPAWVSDEDFAPSLFEDPTTLDHRWYPLEPGMRHDYRGSSLEDGERLHHGVTVIVTDLTKVINGVRTRVVWERDYTEGELVETELALFAQDKYGNVWHLGQYPEEWEEGEMVATPAWVHAIAGARAGITIPASPSRGTPDFAQGFAPKPLNWIDRGRVYRTGQRTCVPEDCYSDVVVIEEFERTIPDAYQDKYYAPGVGVVRVGWRGSNDESKEVLELVDSRTLSAPEMDEVRDDALALEDRAYELSADVWGRTARSEVTSE